MGAKVIVVFTIIATGWMLTDALLHPKGVAALGSAVNGTLTTVGNQVTGVSTSGAKVLGS